MEETLRELADIKANQALLEEAHYQPASQHVANTSELVEMILLNIEPKYYTTIIVAQRVSKRFQAVIRSSSTFKMLMFLYEEDPKDYTGSLPRLNDLSFNPDFITRNLLFNPNGGDRFVFNENAVFDSHHPLQGPPNQALQACGR